MNYIGSKRSLIPFLESVISDVVGADLSDKIFCDIFAGTGIVGSTFKPLVRKVIANDWEYYSYVLNRNYIGNHLEMADKYERLAELNRTEGVSGGFIYNNYCAGSGSGRQYFSDDNGKRIDAMRIRLREWMESGEISEDLYFFLLASLIESADKLANTTSVYGAFLKHLKRTAQKPLVVAPAEYSVNENSHEVYCQDANVLVRNISGDILYLDPPYNSRQYGANYHLLNTIAEYKDFVPQGKTGLRDYMRSSYCGKRTVLSSFDSLVRDADFKYIILSYNNEGLMSLKEIESVMSKYGHYDVVNREYQRYRADREENRNHTADHTIEYLHILEK